MQKLNENMIFEKREDPEVLLVLFTGFANLLMIQPFEFLQVSGLYNSSRILVRDPSQRMYLGGIGGSLDSFDKMIESIRQVSEQLGSRRIIVIGSSGGGHTAILAAHLLKADYAHAFAPFPYCSFARVLIMRDWQMLRVYWRQMIRVTIIKEVRKYLDLRPVLERWNRHTRYYVHICRQARRDHKRAQYLKNLPNVDLVSYPCDQHTVIRYLAKQKLLKNIFLYRNQEQIVQDPFKTNGRN